LFSKIEMIAGVEVGPANATDEGERKSGPGVGVGVEILTCKRMVLKPSLTPMAPTPDVSGVIVIVPEVPAPVTLADERAAGVGETVNDPTLPGSVIPTVVGLAVALANCTLEVESAKGPGVGVGVTIEMGNKKLFSPS
jgi:hypothetical protein